MEGGGVCRRGVGIVTVTPWTSLARGGSRWVVLNGAAWWGPVQEIVAVERSLFLLVASRRSQRLEHHVATEHHVAIRSSVVTAPAPHHFPVLVVTPAPRDYSRLVAFRGEPARPLARVARSALTQTAQVIQRGARHSQRARPAAPVVLRASPPEGSATPGGRSSEATRSPRASGASRASEASGAAQRRDGPPRRRVAAREECAECAGECGGVGESEGWPRAPCGSSGE